jgi:hypothetical protein
MAKVKKAQAGKNVPKGMVESEMYPGKMIPKSRSNYENGSMAKSLSSAKSASKSVAKPKAVMPKKKMKDGGKASSFPDLNKDGKVTKADILKGRGVIKNGGKMAKKAMSGMKMKGGGKCKSGC